MITDSLFAFGVHDFITRHLPNSKDDSIFQYVYAHEGKESFVRFKEYSDLGRKKLIVNFR